MYQNIEFLAIKKAPRLGDRIAMILTDYGESVKYSDVARFCDMHGGGFTTLQFNHDELYLLRKFSEKWDLNYKLLLFAKMEERRLVWPDGNFIKFYDGRLVAYNVTCMAENDNGVILFHFEPTSKAVFYQICDKLDNKSPRPATVCINTERGLYGRKVILHEKMLDEIVAFRTDADNKRQHHNNMLSFKKLKSITQNSSSEHDDCYANTISLFNHTAVTLLTNDSFPDIKIVTQVTFEEVRETYKKWKIIQDQIGATTDKIKNAIEKSKIVTYHDYKSHTMSAFFSKKYFEELANGNLANIFSLTFLLLCATIVIVSVIIIYKCCLKSCMSKLFGIFCPYFSCQCWTNLTKCCNKCCQPNQPQVIYYEVPSRNVNPNFQPRTPRRNQLMLQNNIYEDIFEELD